jgi:hypothetical protein
MGDRYSWGAVPDYIQGGDFEIAIPTYSATVRSRSDIEISAQGVITEIETLYGPYEPIFLVGHSLGGLIAREICRRLLLSDPNALLNKIPAVITVGTPLEGARYGNRLLRWLPFLSPKIRQIATDQYAFEDYREAIREAKRRSASRPKQLHIQMEEDGVIARQVEAHFTEDDFSAAVIPGTHRNFNVKNDDAKYVADVILMQIRKVQNSQSAPNIARSEPVQAGDLPDRLVLIACSHTKENGGEKRLAGTPVQWITEPSLRDRIVSKRSYIYSLLKAGRIADGFERGGNRAHQPANQLLSHGPDLGGPNAAGDDSLYLQAWRRYTGRLYVPVTNAAWERYLHDQSRFRVLIMSGLYGLIEPQELIQNYDIHLSDNDTESGVSVSSMWTELYTECIANFVRHAHHQRKVRIYNLLCDHHYVDAIKWHKLPKECSVYHLASPTLEDVGLLPPAGMILNAFLTNPNKLEDFDPDDRNRRQYELSDFGPPPAALAGTQVIFESRVNFSKRELS